MSRRLAIGVPAVVIVVFGLAAALDAGDVIELPSWLNVKGVDVPLVGDTDVIDCRLASVAGVALVDITLVDGDPSTYPDYAHVWRNGNLVDPDDVVRLADDRFRAPGEKGIEQFYALSIVPERDARVFCESITPR